MTKRAKIIAEYLNPLKDDLKDLYQWSFKLDSLLKILSSDEIEELKKIKSTSTRFETELVLKRIINKNLNDSFQNKKFDKFNQLCNWIVQDWGGIKGGKELKKIEEAIKEIDKLPYDRIASYSKIAAFMNLEDCIIYDSRVAYSLNWILISSNEIKDDFFPIPNGRNSKMMAFDMNVLIHLQLKENYIADDKELKNKLFISNQDKKIFIDKSNAYNQLNLLVKQTHELLWGENDKDLFKTEMLLFSIADKEIYKDIIEKVNFSINTLNEKK